MRKFLIWFFSLLFTIAIGYYVFSKYFNDNWKPILEEKIKNAVIESSDSLYHIKYKSLDVDPVNGNLKLLDFKLIPDSLVYKKFVKENRAPNNLYQLSVDQVILTDANAPKAISEKKLTINNILIKHPILTITNKRFAYNDSIKANKKHKTLYQIINKVFKDISVNSIKLEKIDFDFVDKNEGIKITKIKDLNISVFDILIDANSREDKSRIYYTKNIEIDLPQYSVTTSDKLYKLNLKQLKFSTNANLLSLGTLEMKPLYDTKTFYRKLGFAQDYFNLSFKNINLSDINFDLFLNTQVLNAKLLDIKNGNLSINSTNAYPKKLINKTGKFPHQLLLKLPLKLYINTIKLSDINIKYAEFNKISNQIGSIGFNKTHGFIHNVTNIKSKINSNSLMHAELKSKIFGVAPLLANFIFYLDKTDGSFKLSGVINGFNGKVANQIIRPLGMAEIKSAKIKKLSFNMTGNQVSASSNMDFYYDDLKVNILKKDKNGEFVKQGLVSKVANIFILNESNPDRKGNFFHSTTSFSREAHHSFISLIWKTLFVGIKESIGMSQEKEAKIKKTATAIKSAISDVKQSFKQIKKTKLFGKSDKRERRKRAEKDNNP